MFLAGFLPPPRKRHNAICAKIVAALHDGDKGRRAAYLQLRPLHVCRSKVKQDQLFGRRFQKLQQRLRHGRNAVRARDQAHLGGIFEKLFTELLRHTAANCHANIPAAAGCGLYAAKCAAHLFFRFLPDRAGVDNHKLGLFHGCPGVALFFQSRGQPLGIVDIHLATKGNYMKCARAHDQKPDLSDNKSIRLFAGEINRMQLLLNI
jgi:hypothetical protein